MVDPSRTIKLTTAAGLLLHDVSFQPTAQLDAYERQRLFGAEDPTKTFTVCPCGWSAAVADSLAIRTAAEHVQRDSALPVHRVGGYTAIGSRDRNADAYGSAIDDITGIAAFAVADGIGRQPRAAKAAAVAATTAVAAALAASEDRAVTGLLAARDALNVLDLVHDGDTVMVLAVSRPATAGQGITWDLVWVGDCAAWLIEGNLLTPLTTPHTRGQRLREAGRAEDFAARFDNIVLTTVGTADRATLGATTVTTETGRLVLTSDGVGDAAKREDLHTLLTTVSDPQLCARSLVERGVDRPRADNATALVIDTPHLP